MRFLVSLSVLLAWLTFAFAAGPTTSAVNAPANTLGNLTALAVNMGATGDRATIAIPSWVTAYRIRDVAVANCSVTPILAQFSMFTGAGGTGTLVVAAAVITGATGTSVILPQTLAGTVANTRLTATSLFVRVAVANAAALTCDVHVQIDDWS